jgi:hypothetical protein
VSSNELAYHRGWLNIFRSGLASLYLDINRVLKAAELKDQAEDLLINVKRKK